MTQSPWARDIDTPPAPTRPRQPELQRKRDDRLSQIDQLMRLSVWGNSQVDAYLYHVMDDFPDIDVHKHLFSSYSFRTIHSLVHNTVIRISKNEDCTAADLVLVVEGLIGEPLNDNNFATDAIQDCLNTCKDIKTEYDANNEWPCADHDAIYVTSLYGALMHFAANIQESIPNNHGYIHHSMVRMLADKADTASKNIRTGQLADEALEPRELATHDNIIQHGYRVLDQYLTDQLGKLRHVANNVKPQPTEAFETIALDMDCAGAYLKALHDGLNELCAAHEWIGVYEHLAYRNMCDTDPKSNAQLPLLDANSGIHAYLDDFIAANARTEVHPMDARVLYALFEGIKQSHPMPQPPHRG
jgi:hypothetical protein